MSGVFREIVFGSAEYALECALRDGVLRAPLGLSLGGEDLELEWGELHFGIFDGAGALLACAVARPVSRDEARIRQVAVLPAWRNRGLGRKLMAELESELRRRGFTRFVLHARTAVADFYEKLGYERIGGEFLEVSIPHVEMGKEGKV